MKMESIYRKYIYSISKLDSNDFAYFTSSKVTPFTLHHEYSKKIILTIWLN